MSFRPLGDQVSLPSAVRPSATATLHGRTIELVPLSPSHADELNPLIDSSDPAQSSLWDYMPNGPYNNVDDFRISIAAMSTSTDPFFYAIIDKRELPASASTPFSPHSTYGKAIGYIALMSIVPDQLRIEIGNVLFSLAMQKTTSATEAIYLLLAHSFEELGYRRVEWKCNALNAGSRRAALRIGFSFEGVFRQHMVVKGRNRDTAWFSMLREEWDSGLKRGLERWLQEENFDDQGRQLKSLNEMRGE